MTADVTFDFVIFGGGTAGCVVASRQAHDNPKLQIALIEAGGSHPDNIDTLMPLIGSQLCGTQLD